MSEKYVKESLHIAADNKVRKAEESCFPAGLEMLIWFARASDQIGISEEAAVNFCCSASAFCDRGDDEGGSRVHVSGGKHFFP